MNILPVDLQPNVHICYIFWRSFMLFILIYFNFFIFIFYFFKYYKETF